MSAASLAERIRLLMANGKPRTSTQICEAIKAAPRRVNDFVRFAREPGLDQELHAIDRKGFRGAARYVKGRGANVAFRASASTSPTSFREKPLCRRSTAAPDKWWPAADALVQRSFDAMVRMGARA